MATRGAPTPILAFAPVLRPLPVLEGGVDEPDIVADPEMGVVVLVLGIVLTVEDEELVALVELVVVALDEMLNDPETATRLVCPS